MHCYARNFAHPEKKMIVCHNDHNHNHHDDHDCECEKTMANF